MERFFCCVHRHLNDGGMFLFDIATMSYFTMAAIVPTTVRKFGDNYLRRKVAASGDGTFECRIEVFERQGMAGTGYSGKSA
jgi:predicted TPR repeat methyltransferase